MRWSQIKKTFEENLTSSLQGRLKVHLTNYVRLGRMIGRGWILLDGEEIFSVRTPPSNDEKLEYPSNTMNFGEAIRTLSEQSIEECLTSEDVLVRGFALLDKRCGKRTLEKMDVETEHEFVRLMYALREEKIFTE